MGQGLGLGALAWLCIGPFSTKCSRLYDSHAGFRVCLQRPANRSFFIFKLFIFENSTVMARANAASFVRSFP